RVFVVETQGGNCGYLATVGGLITGATTSYIPETGVRLEQIQRDVRHLRNRFSESKDCGLGCIVLRNEKCSKTYTTEVLSNILREESEGLFDAKTSVLGHLLQGGTPSPLDRYRATRLAAKCVHGEHFVTPTHRAKELRPTVFTPNMNSATVIGIVSTEVGFTPIQKLIKETDFKKRRSLRNWWLPVHDLVSLFAKYGMYPGEEQPYPSQQRAEVLNTQDIKHMTK
ncbi:phosphofructokinase domain-containing protein, partial [Dimargaris cristalligena]